MLLDLLAYKLKNPTENLNPKHNKPKHSKNSNATIRDYIILKKMISCNTVHCRK